MFVADSKLASTPATTVRRPIEGDVWRQLIEPVEPFIESVALRLTRQVNDFDPGLTDYAEYALGGNGKHLRPSLLALSAKAVGDVTEDHVAAAVVIEMVHLATLVHDDVMDEASLRRGRPTLAANWGNEIAVLFGDCLFAEALKLAASFPTPDVCRAVAAATNTVCAGEIVQTRNRGNFELTEADYLRVIDMKTAELFALSCDLAAFLARASEAKRVALRDFGRAFGIAYQVYDDCQDVFGSEAKVGKSLGTDLTKGKMTLPLIELRERASKKDRVRLEQLFSNARPGALGELQEMLGSYDILSNCEAAIARHLRQARQALKTLASDNGTESLSGCTHFLEQQLGLLHRI